MATYSVLRLLKRNAVLQHFNTKALLPTLTAPVASQFLSVERDFHTNSCCCVNHRKEKAVVRHLYYKDHEKTLAHSQSPLVELPDYTYQDGRQTEMTFCQEVRQEKNYNLAKQVVKLVEEMKLAQSQVVAQEESQLRFEEERRKAQLKKKGKPL